MNLAGYIDHTLLKPEATVDDIMRLCTQAVDHGFKAVCVNPCYVGLAVHLLAGTKVKTATVVGFPLGSTLPSVKVFETKEAVSNKADEIDMVINLGAVKTGMWQAVREDIQSVVDAADGRTVKVIVETGLLSENEKIRACQAAVLAGAHFVKTCTGFGPGRATVEDIKLMKSVVGDDLGIKASGGIRTRADAEAMIAAGATRIGTSSGLSIVGGF